MNNMYRIFAAKLILALEEGYDIEKISRWADEFYYKEIDKLDDALIPIVQNISAMSFGNQFVYTENELIDMAIQLIKNGCVQKGII